MADFLMPALGADMETGKVVQWLVQPGARVKSGDVVAVVETHKGAIDVEIFLDGVIDQLVPLDQELPVGAVLAQVQPQDYTMAQGGEARTAPASEPTIATVLQQIAVPTVAVIPPGPGRVRVSPAARRRAQTLGLRPDGLSGSGANGAVTLADVEAELTRREGTSGIAEKAAR